jgi:ATP-dependent Clp protease ATP-binding subunit ClpA
MLGQGVAVNVLQKLGLDLETVRREVEKQVGTGPDQKIIGNIPYTPRVKKVLMLATKEAKALNHAYVGTEHILLGLLREGDGVASRVLQHFEVNFEQTREEILKELDPNFQTPDAHAGFAASNADSKPQSPGMLTNATTPKPQRDLVDTSKRYDVYCTEQTQEVVVYRNALFKGAKCLLPKHQDDSLSEFVELEQADGQTLFVARYSIIKFCDPGATPTPETIPSKKA